MSETSSVSSRPMPAKYYRVKAILAASAALLILATGFCIGGAVFDDVGGLIPAVMFGLLGLVLYGALLAGPNEEDVQRWRHEEITRLRDRLEDLKA